MKPGGYRFFSVLCLLVAAFGAAMARADGAASVSTEVPAGQWRAVSLRNLTSGAVLAVEVESDGPLPVYLVQADQLGRRKAKALFRGIAERKLSFSVVIPQAGNYVAVMDNRGGDDPRTIRFSAAAAHGKSGSAPGGVPESAPPELNL